MKSANEIITELLELGVKDLVGRVSIAELAALSQAVSAKRFADQAVLETSAYRQYLVGDNQGDRFSFKVSEAAPETTWETSAYRRHLEKVDRLRQMYDGPMAPEETPIYPYNGYTISEAVPEETKISDVDVTPNFK